MSWALKVAKIVTPYTVYILLWFLKRYSKIPQPTKGSQSRGLVSSVEGWLEMPALVRLR